MAASKACAALRQLCQRLDKRAAQSARDVTGEASTDSLPALFDSNLSREELEKRIRQDPANARTALLLAAGALSLPLATVAMRSVGPLAVRRLLTGEAFPRYERGDELVDSSYLPDLGQQGLSMLTSWIPGLPLGIIAALMKDPLARAAARSAERGETNLATTLSPVAEFITPAAVSALSLMLTEPLTRALILGSAYPTYRTRTNRKVQHTALTDALYGAALGLPSGALNAAAATWGMSLLRPKQ